MNNSKEIECKWEAHSLLDYNQFLEFTQNLGAKLSRSWKIRINDTYVDTPEKFFQNSHLECRIRLSVGHSELTLKSFSGTDKNLFIRNEKTVQLPLMSSNKMAFRYCRNCFFKNIQPLFEILNKRQIQTLVLPCGTWAEACFDQVVMLCGKKKLRMYEIELEFKRGDLDAFKAFVGQLSPLNLIPSKFSKYEMGMRHLLPDTLSCSLETLQDTANHLLKKNLVKLKENEANLMISFNPEAIHDMRVAIRRLRALIKTFKKMFPKKAQIICERLQKVSRLLGKKRDLDIFSAFIFQILQLAPQIDRFQKQILSMLRSKDYASPGVFH